MIDLIQCYRLIFDRAGSSICVYLPAFQFPPTPPSSLTHHLITSPIHAAPQTGQGTSGDSAAKEQHPFIQHAGDVLGPAVGEDQEGAFEWLYTHLSIDEEAQSPCSSICPLSTITTGPAHPHRLHRHLYGAEHGAVCLQERTGPLLWLHRVCVCGFRGAGDFPAKSIRSIRPRQRLACASFDARQLAVSCVCHAQPALPPIHFFLPRARAYNRSTCRRR